MFNDVLFDRINKLLEYRIIRIEKKIHKYNDDDEIMMLKEMFKKACIKVLNMIICLQIFKFVYLYRVQLNQNSKLI